MDEQLEGSRLAVVTRTEHHGMPLVVQGNWKTDLRSLHCHFMTYTRHSLLDLHWLNQKQRR